MRNNHTILPVCLIAGFRKHFFVLDSCSGTRFIRFYCAGFNGAPCGTVGTLLEFVSTPSNGFNFSLYTRLLAVFNSRRNCERVFENFWCIGDTHIVSCTIFGVNNSMARYLAVFWLQDGQRRMEENLSVCINSVTCKKAI